MKAVVFHDVGDIRLDDVEEPVIKDKQDAIVRLTSSAICGTDLHMVRGTMPGMESGTILGHEGVGVIEELGEAVRNFYVGDRVVIPSTIACGYCSYCREGYFSQCDHANPNGKAAGTAFFGGPKETGPFNGMQAEKVRVPFANVGLVKIPDNVTDDQAILVSDIFPTGYFGADLADIEEGHIVAVFGCGPVGLFTIMSAQLKGASRVIAIDQIPDRLEKARELGAEVINFSEEDPIKTLRELTGDIGPDRVIDAVGIDAEHPEHGMAYWKERLKGKENKIKEQVNEIAPKQNPDGNLWQPGKAPFQAIEWAVEAIAKGGTIAVIGVYPEQAENFPLGKAMNKNLTIKLGNCNHRKYIPMLLNLVASGVVEPRRILTKQEPLNSAIEAFEAFDQREQGWIKVELQPQQPDVM